MPKKVVEYNKQYNVKISEYEYNLWKSKAKELKFGSISRMIRNTVNELIEGNNTQKVNIDTTKIEKELQEIKKENRQMKEELLALNRQMLKFLSDTYNNGKTTKTITMTEKIINLIKEQPKTLEQLVRILGAPEVEVLSFLNDLVKKDLIYFNPEFMEWSVL